MLKFIGKMEELLKLGFEQKDRSNYALDAHYIKEFTNCAILIFPESKILLIRQGYYGVVDNALPVLFDLIKLGLIEKTETT